MTRQCLTQLLWWEISLYNVTFPLQELQRTEDIDTYQEIQQSKGKVSRNFKGHILACSGAKASTCFIVFDLFQKKKKKKAQVRLFTHSHGLTAKMKGNIWGKRKFVSCKCSNVLIYILSKSSWMLIYSHNHSAKRKNNTNLKQFKLELPRGPLSLQTRSLFINSQLITLTAVVSFIIYTWFCVLGEKPVKGGLYLDWIVIAWF